MKNNGLGIAKTKIWCYTNTTTHLNILLFVREYYANNVFSLSDIEQRCVVTLRDAFLVCLSMGRTFLIHFLGGKIMWNNIGGKIKGLIKILFWLEVIANFILGIVFMSNYGLLFWICGPLVAWLSNITLYGFAELIENSKVTAKNSQITALLSNINLLNEQLKLDLITEQEYADMVELYSNFSILENYQLSLFDIERKSTIHKYNKKQMSYNECLAQCKKLELLLNKYQKTKK